MNTYVTPKPHHKWWVRYANWLFYEKNWNSLDKTLLQSFFALKPSYKALVLPLKPP